MRYIYIIILLSFFVFACNKKSDEDSQKKAETTKKIENEILGQIVIQNDSLLKIADFQMRLPSNWINEEPSSEMRIVQYALKEDENVKVLGFYFGDRPDMADANIERWKAEFTKTDDFRTEDVAGGKIKYVQISGTYKKKPFPMSQDFTETPDYMTIAAIVPSMNGPYFFKAVGPKKTIENDIPNFKSFLSSYKTTQ